MGIKRNTPSRGGKSHVLFCPLDLILIFAVLIANVSSVLAFVPISSTAPLLNHKIRRRHKTVSLLPLHAKRGGKGKSGGGGGGKSKGTPDRLVDETLYVEVEEDGSDAWRCADITDILRRGGVGCLPTDTGYGFVTPIDSKGGKHSWARKSLGVRMPDDPVLRYVQEELGGTPLLVSSVPNESFDDLGDEEEDGEGDGIIGVAQLQSCRIDFGSSWCQQVDFVVDGGERPVEGSTIYDLTGEPTLLRQGLGNLDLV